MGFWLDAYLVVVGFRDVIVVRYYYCYYYRHFHCSINYPAFPTSLSRL